MDRKQRVLLIEDRVDEARIYARIIAHGGSDVDLVHSDNDAVRYLDERFYEVAVVDMNLSSIEGDNSGGERILNHARKLAEPPALVVFTAHDDPQFAADTVQEGRVARFVSKNSVTQHGAEPLLHSIRTAIDTSKSKRDRPRDILRLLMGPEQEDIWIDAAFRRTLGFRGGQTNLLAFLDQLVGNFRSKGIGAPVLVEVYAAAAAAPPAIPAQSVAAREYEQSGLRGVVWK